MPQTQLPMAGVAPDPGPPPKAQKAFDKLVKQIRAARENLDAWTAVIPSYQHKYHTELRPLHDSWRDLQTRLVHRLDRACDQKGFTKTERSVAAGLIIELTESLLAEQDDAELRTLYHRHSGCDYGDAQKEAFDVIKSALEDAWGIDLGDIDDIDIDSPEELLRRAQEQYASDEPQHEAPQAARKPSAKQQAEEHQILQSIRTIYRKLASALHPDRESDPEKRDRKTVLMQHTNQAYEENNLFQLLELSQQLARDQGTFHALNDSQLKIYIKALKKDLAEVEQEIQSIENTFRASFGLPPLTALSPRAILRKLSVDIGDAKQAISDMENDLRAFENTRHLKDWLMAVRHQAQRPRAGGFR